MANRLGARLRHWAARALDQLCGQFEHTHHAAYLDRMPGQPRVPLDDQVEIVGDGEGHGRVGAGTSGGHHVVAVEADRSVGRPDGGQVELRVELDRRRM